MKIRIALLVMITVALGVMFSTPGITAPTPSVATANWQINIDYQSPEPLLLKIPGEAKPQLFWYFRYTVTNRTGKERSFHPNIVLFTNTGEIIQAGDGVSPIVFEKIRSIANNPLLLDQWSIGGKLLQGQDNAKDGVAIFRDFDPKATSFDIFVGGLSGETTSIKLPAPIKVTESGPDGKERTITKTKVFLTKTLRLNYIAASEAAQRQRSKVQLVEKDWIMR
ncbi:MAG: hypothetical protein KAR11_01285 [Phycisphaerae bacterium]|nr:hypothetical protein [Phycisphaerae bacterium]